MLTEEHQLQHNADHAPLHARLATLMDRMRQMPLVECEVTHHFSPGVYSRVVYIPAGVTVVGKIHKKTNQLTMLQGHASVVDADGEPHDVHAPMVWISPPGVQRAVHAYTPCIFMSTHGTQLTDVAQIEREFIAQDMLEYQQFLLENNNTKEA